MYSRLYNICRLLLVAVLLGTLTGCGTSLKSAWGDFTAYYNTFYNAKKSFRSGYNKVKEQKVEVNPEQPIRVHPAPVKAGNKDFQNAIDKGAEILRKHPDSRWVDDALLLIGKSYFYNEKYFSADQKFYELYRNSENREMVQRAVMWRGRVYMEMGLNTQGISYLEDELKKYDKDKWEKSVRAEVYALLAEMYTGREEWQSANDYLVNAIPDLHDKTHKARAYFLHGQVLEKLDRLEEAAGAYRQVEKYHPAYELVYQSKRKEAEVSRDLGQYDRAYDIFSSMARDDKNFDVQAALNYEIGRTEQERGDYEEAESIYKQVLHNSIQPPTKETMAKSYYGLAEIYRNYYKNFELTAAYYDSAAGVSVAESKLPENFRAETLADSFGEYARLKKEINRKDSLMWLGSLPRAKFDSVLTVIKERRAKQLAEQRRQQQRQSNTMVNVGRQRRQETTESNFQSGFLNYKDPNQVQQSKNQFHAIWGERPLVDNWRRIVAIRSASSQGSQADTTQTDSTAANEQQRREEVAVVNAGDQEIRIDLSEIPFTPEARTEMQKGIAQSTYELGNTFFLSLDMPDSAAAYYHKVIEQYPDSKLAPQAMYSLSELYYVNNQEGKAREWAQRLVEAYPESRYIPRLAGRYDLPGIDDEQQVTTTEVDSVRIAYEQIADTLSDTLSVAKAETLRSFAARHADSQLSPRVMMQSARTYMQMGRQDSLFRTEAPKWYKGQTQWVQQKQQLQALKDSARIVLKDTTLNESARKKWQTIADSTAPDPAYEQHFPFRGAYWDSTRSVLSQISSLFADFSNKEKVRELADQLTIPDRFKKPAKPAMASADSAATDSLDETRAQLQGPVDTTSAAIDTTSSPPTDTTSTPADTIASPAKASIDSVQADSVESDTTKAEASSNRKERASCKELGLQPKIVGGMDKFLKNVRYSPQMQSLGISGEITYVIDIDKTGRPHDFELKPQNSKMITESDIPKAFGRAILQSLRFQPLVHQGDTVAASCEVTFPVRLKKNEEAADTEK